MKNSLSAVVLAFTVLIAEIGDAALPVEHSLLSEYLIKDVPKLSFENKSPAEIVRELDRSARSAGLEDFGYKGIFIVRPHADGERINAIVEGSSFGRVLEIVANSLGCYILENQGTVIMMPVDVLDANLTLRSYVLTKRTMRVLSLKPGSTEFKIFRRLSAFRSKPSIGSSARVSADGKFLILRAHPEDADVVGGLLTLIERGVIIAPPAHIKGR